MREHVVAGEPAPPAPASSAGTNRCSENASESRRDGRRCRRRAASGWRTSACRTVRHGPDVEGRRGRATWPNTWSAGLRTSGQVNDGRQQQRSRARPGPDAGRRWIAPTLTSAPHAQDADEEAGQDGLEAQRGSVDAGDHPAHGVGVVERAEAHCATTVRRAASRSTPADHAARAAREQSPRSSVTNSKNRAQPRVRGISPSLIGERLREDREQDRLVAAQDGQAREQQRVRVEGHAARSSAPGSATA